MSNGWSILRKRPEPGAIPHRDLLLHNDVAAVQKGAAADTNSKGIISTAAAVFRLPGISVFLFLFFFFIFFFLHYRRSLSEPNVIYYLTRSWAEIRKSGEPRFGYLYVRRQIIRNSVCSQFDRTTVHFTRENHRTKKVTMFYSVSISR